MRSLNLVVVGALCAGLALAGVLFQQTLRNPLAAPTTLGVVGGVHLALLVGTLFAPALRITTFRPCEKPWLERHGALELR